MLELVVLGKKLRSQILDAEQRAQSMDYHQLKDGQRLIAIGHNYARISILSFDTGKLVKSCQQNTANVFPVTGIKLCDFDGKTFLKSYAQLKPLCRLSPNSRRRLRDATTRGMGLPFNERDSMYPQGLPALWTSSI